MIATGKSCDELFIEFNTSQDKNLEDMESYIDSIFEKYNKEYSRLLAGETKLINFFIGNIIKESKGKYNPSSITNYLKKKFDN